MARVGTCFTSCSAAVRVSSLSCPKTPSERGPPAGGKAHSCRDLSSPSWKPPTRCSTSFWFLGSKVTSIEAAAWSSASTATYWICGVACNCCCSAAIWALVAARSPPCACHPTSTAATVASAPAAAAPRHQRRLRHQPDALAASARASSMRCWAWSACTRFWMRSHTAGSGAMPGCNSAKPDQWVCHTSAAARTAACSRASVSKRRRAPPRSVPRA